MDAVILAAGKGLRLRPFTETKPKGLVDIAGEPLLIHTFKSLPKSTSQVHLVVGYLGEQIKNYFGKTFMGLPISYYIQDPLTGTGSAVQLIKETVKENFLVVNGDDLYEQTDLEALTTYPLAILAHAEDAPLKASILENTNHELIGLGPSNPPGTPTLRTCGAYMLNKSFFEEPLVEIPVRGGVEFSLPHALVNLASHKPVQVVRATHWQPVGTPEELETAKRKIQLLNINQNF